MKTRQEKKIFSNQIALIPRISVRFAYRKKNYCFFLSNCLSIFADEFDVFFSLFTS